ncbi:MAG: hypothetical protein IT431_01080 [Phycisphaerales bacterium]|nr:hypothetical protein [Phycisphaerales bacterium]
MRNVFDQYSQPENRLTHALVSALAHDRSLLVPFLRWAGASGIPPVAKLRITEQQVPGELVTGDEAEAERRGLPDACVFDDDGWALLVEAKVASRVKRDQLDRHVRTAGRHGFERPHLLVVAVDPPSGQMPPRCVHREWREVYAWFRRHAARSPWARAFVEYMQVFESRMVAADYSIRGTLTMFDGLRFDDDNPYNYREAKRLIRLLGDELQARKELKRIGADPTGKRRTAITGGGTDPVWDFIPLKAARGSTNFTANPHLTMTLGSEGANATITVPNGVKGGFRTRLQDMGGDGFCELMAKLERGTRRVRTRSKGSTVIAYAVQRHYRSQRSSPTVDGRLAADLRTIVKGGSGGVKYQPQWLDSIYTLLTEKRSNIQFGVGVHFSYGCPVLRSAKAVDLFAEAWIGLAPLLEAARG